MKVSDLKKAIRDDLIFVSKEYNSNRYYRLENSEIQKFDDNTKKWIYLSEKDIDSNDEIIEGYTINNKRDFEESRLNIINFETIKRLSFNVDDCSYFNLYDFRSRNNDSYIKDILTNLGFTFDGDDYSDEGGTCIDFYILPPNNTIYRLDEKNKNIKVHIFYNLYNKFYLKLLETNYKHSRCDNYCYLTILELYNDSPEDIKGYFIDDISYKNNKIVISHENLIQEQTELDNKLKSIKSTISNINYFTNKFNTRYLKENDIPF